MIATDEAALRCDFLETYHVYDYRALPARQAAIFACGLGEHTRIMRRLSGAPAGMNTVLLAVIADALKILVWQNTVDGSKGINRPASIVEAMLNKRQETAGFSSIEEFEAWRNSLLEGADD